MSDWDRFVGIPYADKGRDLSGCDCWGLVFLVYRSRGIALPSFHDRYTLPADRKALAALIAGELEPWDEIPRGCERTLDALLMREAGHVRHIGVVTEPGMVLHVERGGTSAIERYRAGNLRHRVAGIYRYRDHE